MHQKLRFAPARSLQALLTMAYFLAIASCTQPQTPDTSTTPDYPTANEEQQPNQQVQTQLHADAASIAPGKPFHLGVQFTIEPKTHIYWRNPGDSGLPTGIEWTLPEGFTAAPIQWPAPVRFEIEELNDISYGYANEVFLVAQITPPDTLDADSVTITAAPYWLACEEDGQCIPGSAQLEITIPTGDGAPSSKAALFEDASKNLLIEIGQIPFAATISATETMLTITSTTNVLSPIEQPANAYPYGEGHWNAVRHDEKTIEFEPTDDADLPFNGVVTIHIRDADTDDIYPIHIQVGEPPSD